MNVLYSVILPVALLLIIRDCVRRYGPSRPKLTSEYALVQSSCFDSKVTEMGVDFIFVHGLGSNPDTTWRMLAEDPSPNGTNTAVAEAKYVNWIIDFLPEDFPEALRRNSRVFFYNYDSYWLRDATEERRSRLGSDLWQEVYTNAAKTPNRGIIFVGHSYGGLVIKEALSTAHSYEVHRKVNIYKQTKGVFFLGTPHRGSDYTSIGIRIVQFLNLFGFGADSSLMQEFTYDSLNLQDMHRRFEAIPGNFRTISYYERLKMTEFWGLWKGIVVKEQSATLDRPGSESISLHTTHTQMNKFAKKDANYRKILDKLVEVGEEAIQEAKSRMSVYSVPEESARQYTERRDLEAALGDVLKRDDKDNDLHAVGILGLGGSGKTQLALRYAENNRHRYDTILWIDARTESTIISSLQRCAQALDLPPVTVSPTAKTLALKDDPLVNDVKSCLQNRSPLQGEWLVVIDNADDPKGGLQDIIPSGARGNIILTSRSRRCVQKLPDGSPLLEVGIMRPKEAVDLLLKYLESDDINEPQDTRDLESDITNKLQDTRDLALRICENIQYLPLAIHLAGAYINSEKSFDPDLSSRDLLENYLKAYKNHKNRLLGDPSVTSDVSSYDQTVATVWDTSLDAIEDEYPGIQSRQLLIFLANMNPTKIQDKLFQLVAESLWLSKRKDLPEWIVSILQVRENTWDAFNYKNMLKPLVNFGLINRVNGDDPFVSMHPLVQWKAKLCEKDDQRAWNLHYYSAFIAVASHQTIEIPNDASFQQHIVPHLPLLEDLLSLNDPLIWAWTIIGQTYQHVGRTGPAEALFGRALVYTFETKGPDHPDTLASMHNLASIYRTQGRWEDAESLQLQVLNTQKIPDHPDTLNSMNSLALLYLNQGRWEEAELLQLQALDASKRILGPNHPGTLYSMNNLALLYLNQGRWEEAESLQLQELDAQKTIVGPDHPTTLITMHNIASTYRAQGRGEEAESLQLQVLDAQKSILGSDHPDTLNSMNSLALSYLNQGRWEEAEPLQLQALDAQKRILGPNHLDTLVSMNNLGGVYSNQGRWEEAESLHSQALDISKRIMGPNHPNTLVSMNNLGDVYSNQGRWEEAESLQSQALDISKRIMGPNHPDTLRYIENLDNQRSRRAGVASSDERAVLDAHSSSETSASRTGEEPQI